jgi:hypothetical protein
MAIPMSVIGASMVLSNMSMNRKIKGGGSLPPKKDDDDDNKNEDIWVKILGVTLIVAVFIVLLVVSLVIFFK